MTPLRVGSRHHLVDKFPVLLLQVEIIFTLIGQQEIGASSDAVDRCLIMLGCDEWGVMYQMVEDLRVPLTIHADIGRRLVDQGQQSLVFELDCNVVWKARDRRGCRRDRLLEPASTV